MEYHNLAFLLGSTDWCTGQRGVSYGVTGHRSMASLGPCGLCDRTGPLKILDIYMYFNNKIYWFVRNMCQNICYSSEKYQTWAV
jgi:hypothetical protein